VLNPDLLSELSLKRNDSYMGGIICLVIQLGLFAIAHDPFGGASHKRIDAAAELLLIFYFHREIKPDGLFRSQNKKCSFRSINSFVNLMGRSSNQFMLELQKIKELSHIF